MSSQISPVGLITGGASGMGLAVVERLVERGWSIYILDKDRRAGEEVMTRLGAQVLFLETDVTNYEEQAQAFARVYAQRCRLDFVYANAGIGDQIDFIEPVEETEGGVPPKPDTSVLDVNLLAVVYTSYLALHFFRKNATKTGSLAMTSSLAGIYAAPGVTVYAATKHGVVGLTRSLAYRLAKRGEAITVNAVCPALVLTGLIPADVAKRVPPEFVTPTATIVKAIESFIDDPSLTGQVVECSGRELFYHPVTPFSNKGTEWVMMGGLKQMMQEREVTE